MTPSDKKNIKSWVEAWKNAAPALKKVKRDELSVYDYNKNLAVIDSMLEWACEHRRVRLTSGLVEQQRLFKKLHEKTNRVKPRS